jgi:hypothetical protein
MLIVAKSVVQNVSDLRHVSGFLLAFRFLYTNNTDLHDKTEILLKVVLNTITLTLTHTLQHTNKESK